MLYIVTGSAHVLLTASGSYDLNRRNIFKKSSINKIVLSLVDTVFKKEGIMIHSFLISNFGPPVQNILSICVTNISDKPSYPNGKSTEERDYVCIYIR